MRKIEFDLNQDARRAYRSALGRFATGVALVAASDDEGVARAITINSFGSVSLLPPIVSWAIDEASDRFHLFTSARDFSINVLRADQRALSDRFTKRTEARIPEDDLDYAGTTPIIKGVLSQLVCETRFLETVGDHTVVFATVTAFADHGPGDALGYYNGTYITLKGN